MLTNVRNLKTFVMVELASMVKVASDVNVTLDLLSPEKEHIV